MNRADLIAAMKKVASAEPKSLTVPGWGKIYIKPLSVKEVQDKKPSVLDPESKRALAIGVANVICDQKGNRVFNVESDEDVSLIESQPWPMLQKIIDASNAFNGLGDVGEVEAKKD
jgi:hypothetical protein